ncbi:MAG: L,D-transpeptidase family protein [Candidatus Omnitrophica bacterium]|nr:L,D-transpeptidase family protein [Candidatus Omnitrophota bacterium]
MYRISYIFILMLAADARPLYAAGIPQELPGLAAETQQAVVVEAGTGVVARVSGWERKDGSWQQVLSPVEAVVGRNGLAPEGEKREGDGRTPSGTFALRRAFGYEENVPTGLVYRRVTERDFWIDDSRSVQYNQWVTGETPKVSHEVLRRGDGLYRYAVVIEYNTGPVVPGLGSAIFLHVWRGAGQPTAGCVAVAEADLLRILHWLDTRRDPVIILRKEP